MALGGIGIDSEEHGLQIAPLLDVMFVLLLFFMVITASQTLEKELSLQLKSRGASQNQDKPIIPIYLKIAANHQVFFNKSPVDTTSDPNLPQLKERLSLIAQQYGTLNPVIIVPEANVSYQRVIEVLNLCALTQMKNIQFQN